MSNNPFTENVREKAKSKNALVAFPDAEDKRTLEASIFLLAEGIARPLLIGNKEKIHSLAKEHKINIDNIEIIEPETSSYLNEFAHQLYEKRKSKGMTEEEALALMKNPLYFAGFLLENNKVDVVVGGNISSTGSVIKAAIYSVGLKPGISLVSSFFIMTFPDKMYCFADCAVNPNPTAEQLCDIAISSARNFQSITGIVPKVAMLSFSTNGSASHEMVEKVQIATKLLKEKAPDIESDGEMQLDAAIIPSIGQRKFPNSKVAGNANVLIFPDLNAGNIGYKLVERLAGAEAVGPIVQGLNKPYCDLSRGCSVDDMINVASICSLM